MARQLKEKGGQRINDFVTLSGSIEGDMIFAEDYEGASSSEFDLSTEELVFDVKTAEWAKGHIVVDYDGGDDEDLYIDEANITLGQTETIPLFLTAGKIYAPFGDFSTNMIQDPLTLTVGEINAILPIPAGFLMPLMQPDLIASRPWLMVSVFTLVPASVLFH